MSIQSQALWGPKHMLELQHSITLHADVCSRGRLYGVMAVAVVHSICRMPLAQHHSVTCV